MNNDAPKPLLSSVDWNEEWKSLQTIRQRFDDASAWDARAKTFPVKHGSQHGYVERFLKLADILPDESVLDMGCGTGALATPLAQSGHDVIACDFSKGMIDVMLADQKALGVSNLKTHVMSWQDDWEQFGLTDGCVDVALASRSIATFDLQESLLKLHRVARRRVCLTLPGGPSPKCDPQLLEAAGFRERVGRDFLYAFNILVANGIAPEVSYIPNTRLELFPTAEDALATFTDVVSNAVAGLATEEELAAIPQRLEIWLSDHLVHDESGFHLAQPRNVTWAFLAWNK